MLSAFRWNLRMMSYATILVGAFLIYNTISAYIVRRRRQIGIVRAVGASRAMVQAAFLFEGGRLRRPRCRGRPRAGGGCSRSARVDTGRADRQLALREQHAGGDRAAPLDHRDRGRFRDGSFGAVRVVAGAGSGRGGAHRSDGRSRARLQRPDREPPLHRGCRGPGPAGGGVLSGAAGGSDPPSGDIWRWSA